MDEHDTVFQAPAPRNGNAAILKVVLPLIGVAIVAAVGLAWSLNGRVSHNETCLDVVEKRLERMDLKLDRILDGVRRSPGGSP